MKKADIALTVGGILASMVVAYLVYKMEQRNNAANIQAAAQAASDAAANSAQQNSYAAALPAISIPSASVYPTSTDTTASASTTPGNSNPAYDTIFESLVSAIQTPGTTVQPLNGLNTAGLNAGNVSTPILNTVTGVTSNSPTSISPTGGPIAALPTTSSNYTKPLDTTAIN